MSGPSPAPRRPSLERVLFGLAGSMALTGALNSAVVSPWFLLLVAFVGVNQWVYVVAGDCPASLILRRAGGPESGCPR
jgi:hypothetical protein